MYMKRLQYLLMLLAVVAFSCSKDEDAEPSAEDLDEVQLSLSTDEQLIEVPEALLQTQNEYTQMAAMWISMANNISSYVSIFQNIPEGAEKSSTPITPSNGRVAAAAKSYLVYHWEGDGMGIAYQIHAEGSKYIFELFYKFQGSNEYQRYLYAEEAKDKKSGKIEAYDIWDTGGLALRYKWATNGDILTFDLESFNSEGLISLEVNQSTQAGTLSFFSDGALSYLITWNGDGSGTWTDYSGDEEMTGSWES